MNEASVQASVPNDNQELKPTAPSTVVAPLENADLGVAGTVMDDDLVESGPVNEAGESHSAEPVEEKVQGGDQPVPISSWYSPWGWYSSANADKPVQLQSEGPETNTISVSMHEDPQPEPDSTQTPGGEPVPTHPPINPITTSMEANWGGWASFFSSTTSMVKTLGYGSVQDVKRDEDGMEVMDLDDDDDKEHRDASKDSGRGDGGNGWDLSSSPPIMSNPIAKTRPLNSRDSQTPQIKLLISDPTGNKGEQAAPKSPAKSSVSSTPKKENSETNTPVPVPIPPSSSPSSRDGNLSQSASTTPPKNSNTRPASPAPSKKSIPSSPPLPNLVLPTWEHTFNTAPRNVVRKSQRDLEDKTVGGKLLGKTMKFVSEVLFARDGSPKSKGKEKAADQDSDISRDLKKWEEERFKEFGKELPKAWQIEEAGLDADTRSTTPLSHIPTFGFYSADSPKKSDVPLINEGSQAGVGASGVDENQGAGSHSDGMKDVLRGCKRVVVIGIHGWFPGIVLQFSSGWLLKIVFIIQVLCYGLLSSQRGRAASLPT